MELDVVNLIKQVSIEHVDKMKERGLELKWNVPEEKVLLMLDNQKTYRILKISLSMWSNMQCRAAGFI